MPRIIILQETWRGLFQSQGEFNDVNKAIAESKQMAALGKKVYIAKILKECKTETKTVVEDIAD
jgi:hypothetical protein